MDARVAALVNTTALFVCSIFQTYDASERTFRNLAADILMRGSLDAATFHIFYVKIIVNAVCRCFAQYAYGGYVYFYHLTNILGIKSIYTLMLSFRILMDSDAINATSNFSVLSKR